LICIFFFSIAKYFLKDFDTKTLNDDSGKSNGTEISSRCVFVATKTTLPAPDGRSKKNNLLLNNIN
jgi:hypothetical protein